MQQPGDYCTSCGEGVFTSEESESYLKAVRAFRDKVDAQPLLPSEVKRIRKKLGLTQKQAGEIFGGGIRAFSQYERGESTQSKATDGLLRLLDLHPELLSEVWVRDAA